MTRSYFGRALPAGILTFALLFVLALFFPSSSQVKALVQPAEIQAVQGPRRVSQAAARLSSTDIFLQLARGVGQELPANRLVDYTLRSGSATEQRYWAIVDFNQPSRNKRLYVF